MILAVVIILVLGMAIGLAAAIAGLLAFHALRDRNGFVIPARPLLVPTTAEQVPADLATLLENVAPALHVLGFEIVANVHAPQMMATVTWTQVLFVRADHGDRASVMLLRPATTPAGARGDFPPELIFATELADGRSVKTSRNDLPPAASTEPSGPPPPPEPTFDRVAVLYQRHRARVEQILGPDARGDLPETGGEIAWLAARAGVIAGVLAEHNGFVPAADGTSYRPPWGRCVRMAWTTITTRGLFPRRSAGFDVVFATSPPEPVAAAKIQ